MNCPYCINQETNVLESRCLPDGTGIRRRRDFLKCNKRFTTHETVVKIELKVIKKDGSLENYSREKLLKGVRKSCDKRGISDEKIGSFVDLLESSLLARESSQVSSADIGQLVLERLSTLDDLAYLRFASVYMKFDTAEEYGEFVSKQLSNKLIKNE